MYFLVSLSIYPFIFRIIINHRILILRCPLRHLIHPTPKHFHFVSHQIWKALMMTTVVDTTVMLTQSKINFIVIIITIFISSIIPLSTIFLFLSYLYICYHYLLLFLQFYSLFIQFPVHNTYHLNYG